MKKKCLKYLSESELLHSRFCDLDLSLSRSHLNSYVQDYYKQLKSHGFRFKPHLWISDEWFSPEGYCGVAVPFYLLHPRLISLEKSKMGFVEGKSKTEFFKLLFHETGHAFEHAYELSKKTYLNQTFGPFRKRYPRTYKPKENKGHYVIHLGEEYAQAHPCEDFAETFAVCLKGPSYWERKYRNQPVLGKLETMQKLINKYKSKDTKKLFFKKTSEEDITQSEMTLGRYYELKFAEKKKYERQGRILM